MTDEEIVKALENCIDEEKGCVGCCYHEKNCQQMDKDVLDLIRRLQYGYSSASKASEEWREKYEKECKENAEQKAEIERLTKENERLDKLLGEKRIDELKTAREIVAQNCILNEENTELQKQMDELKEQKAFWEGMHDRVCNELEELRNEQSNTDLVTQIYVLKNKLEQAVKDTVNKVFDIVEDEYYKDEDWFTLRVRDRIESECGVEVE